MIRFQISGGREALCLSLTRVPPLLCPTLIDIKKKRTIHTGAEALERGKLRSERQVADSAPHRRKEQLASLQIQVVIVMQYIIHAGCCARCSSLKRFLKHYQIYPGKFATLKRYSKVNFFH